MKVLIDESIKQLTSQCRLGYLVIRNVTVQGTPPSLAQEFYQLQAEVAKRYNLTDMMNVPRLAGVQSVYRKPEIVALSRNADAEALVRRVLQYKGVSFVNSAIDVNHYCSMKFLLPFGIYDLDQVQGDVIYRLAPEMEYTDMAGQHIATEGLPFLADQMGALGTERAAARRTAVTLATRNVLCVVYADASIGETALRDALRYMGDMFVRYNSGDILTQAVLSEIEAC